MPRKVVDVSDIRAAARKAKEANKNQPAITLEQIKKLLPPESFAAYQQLIKGWTRFVEDCLDEDDEDRLPPFQRAPSFENVKLFLTWLVRTSTRVIDGEITDVTLKNRLSTLKRPIKLHTDYRFSKEENVELEDLIHTQLPMTEGLSTKTYEKAIALFDVNQDPIRFGWISGEYEYLHSRVMLQLMNVLIFFGLLGLRPGEAVKSEAWKDSNEGLWYGDFTFRYQISPEYTGYVLLARLRNHKGKRLKESEKPILTPHEDPDRFIRPILIFLSYALADNVFQDCRSFADIEKRRPYLGMKYYEYRIKPEMHNKPYLRALENDETISEDKILNCSSLHNLLSGIGQRAGYAQRLKSYCFGRGFAMAVTKGADAVRWRQLMGHANDGTIQKYMSDIVGVDGQPLVRGKKQKTQLIEMNQSMSIKRNIQAPQPPGWRLTDVRPFIKEPELNGDHLELKQFSPAKKSELRRQTRKKMFLKHRKEFFDTAGGLFQEVDPQLEASVAHSEDKGETEVRTTSRYLQARLRHDTDRQKLIDLIFYCKETSLAELIKPMQNMAN